jgi:hypothetical protein
MLKDIENRGKEFKHTLSDLVNIIRVNMKRYSSKNEKLYRLISLRETCVSKDGKSLVGKLIMKKDLYEGLNSVKGWIDEIKNREKDVGPTLLKNFNTGILIKQNFSKKDYAQFAFFELLYRIQRENPETAKNLLKMVKERTPRKKIDEHFLLTYAGEKFTGESKSEYWVLLAEDIIGFASEDKNIRQFQSSEGKVWVYTGSKLIGRSVVLKEYDFDFFERFLKQRFEYETLKRTEIKTEHPLAFMREGEKSIVLTTREGDTNLREYLKGKSRKDKKLAFKKTIEGGLLAQKLILERVRKEGNEFYADVTFAQVAHSTMIQVLNLEEQLLYRAFLGDERRRYRFGENIHLSELLDAVGEFRQNNYSPIITTVNHGDYFTTNLSEKYSRFDSKHIIADCLFDMAYMALDPVFLEFGREEKAELVFKALGKVADFTDEKKFIGTFDYLLLHNGLGLSASQQAHNEEENAAAILSETLEFSKGKNYERALLNYLKESNARPLLKII